MVKVSEFIAWLKTQDQDAIVEIMASSDNYYCGEWVTSAYRTEFDQDDTGHWAFSKPTRNNKTKTLMLGG